MNTLKSLVEKFYGKILLVIYMGISDSAYWTKECLRERVNAYRKILAAPLRSVLLLWLCYTLLCFSQKRQTFRIFLLIDKNPFLAFFPDFVTISSTPHAFLAWDSPCVLFVSFPCSSCHLKQPASESVLSVIRSPLITFLLLSYMSLFISIQFYTDTISFWEVFFSILATRCAMKNCSRGLQIWF